MKFQYYICNSCGREVLIPLNDKGGVKDIICCKKTMVLRNDAIQRFNAANTYYGCYPVGSGIDLNNSDVKKPLLHNLKETQKKNFKRIAYGQHLACSGDRYAMFHALGMIKDVCVAFFTSYSKINELLNYTKFYATALNQINAGDGHKIVPIITQGDVEEQQSVEREILKSYMDASKKENQKTQKTIEINIDEIKKESIRRTKKIKKDMELKGEDPVTIITCETTKDQIPPPLFSVWNETADNGGDDYIDEYYSNIANKAKQRKILQQHKKAYQDYLEEQNKRQLDAARILQKRAFHSPFIWGRPAIDWKGGNQLYGDTVDYNTISKTDLDKNAAPLLQVHPDLKLVTIGKTHLHLKRLLEIVGGPVFASGSRALGAGQIDDTDMRIIHSGAQEFYSQLCQQVKEKHGGKTDIGVEILLVWCRGLNNTERQKFSSEKLTSQMVNVANEKIIAKGKKNPQHVMNVQLFEQLKRLCQEMSQARRQTAISESELREIVPVLIGDTLYQDMYDIQSTICIGPDEKGHLVEFWKRIEYQLDSASNPTVDDKLNDKKSTSLLRQREFLLKLANLCPLCQIGVRSGMLEFLAYSGIPTVYLERNIDAENPRSGANRIKQLAYDIEQIDELVDNGSSLLPWFRMKHDTSFGLIQNKDRASILNLMNNLSAAGSKKVNADQELIKNGFLSNPEYQRLKHFFQTLYPSAWMEKMRKLPPVPMVESIASIEGGRFDGLVDPTYQPKEPGQLLSFTKENYTPIIGDGNCLFTAISTKLREYRSATQREDLFSPADLRAIACQYLRGNIEQFRQFGITSEYIDVMEMSGTFGGEPEIMALSEVLGINVEIYTIDMRFYCAPIINSSSTHVPTVRLLYCNYSNPNDLSNLNHYNLLNDDA
ncbi:OTU domain-containing protein [Dickeya zeae]|nr:OTU domain-containing protein [Dickeya zeae]